jgi:membrane fusion protein, multidrug efflux system
MPPSSRLRRWGSRILVTLVVATAILGGAAYVMTLPSDHGNQPEAPRRRPEVSVSVAEVKAVTLRETIAGVGTLEAWAEVEISPEISGRVKAIRFEEGSFVEEGAVLFELDEDRLQHQRSARQAALRAVEVHVTNSRRIFERRLQLRARGVMTEEESEEAEATLETALADKDRLEAELSLIERELDDTKIVAPAAGFLSQREVDRGAHVTVGRTLAWFYQIDPLQMSFWLPERHLSRVQQGQPVAVTVAAYPDREFQGIVEFISPAVDAVTRQFLVKAVIPNAEHELKPGLFALATVTVGERPDRPVLPEEALVATRRGYLVFVIEDGVAVSREVATGLRHEGLVEIVEGLAVGELVVREGHLRLNGGETVRIAEEEENETDAFLREGAEGAGLDREATP